MEMQRQAMCPENDGLAEFIWSKRKEMAEGQRGVSENLDRTLQKAYYNVCRSKNPIKTLKDFSKIKGVGKWILRLTQGFFDTDSGASENEEMTKKGNKNKGTKQYMPQKNSVAYALLITLYRGTVNGTEFMRKQELIDAAEASGLSRGPIASEPGKGKPGRFGSSPREWYSGWSCMKTLISKGLVVKSSCPAKYMLTEEGNEAARECLLRSGLVDSNEKLGTTKGFLNLDQDNILDMEFSHANSVKETTLPSVISSRQKLPIDVPLEFLDKFMLLGFSKEQIVRASSEVLNTSQNKDMSSLWPAVLCRLREDQVYGSPLESGNTLRGDHLASTATNISRDGQVDIVVNDSRYSGGNEALDIPKSSFINDSMKSSFTMRACSSTVQV